MIRGVVFMSKTETSNVQKDSINDGRKFPYFQVSNSLVDRDDLTNNEKMVYIVLCRYAGNKDTAFPSYETIGKKAGVSKRTAITMIQNLKSKNLIKKTERRITKKGNCKEYTSNIYTVLDCDVKTPPSEMIAPPSEMVAPPPSEMVAPPSEMVALEVYISKKKYNSYKDTATKTPKPKTPKPKDKKIVVADTALIDILHKDIKDTIKVSVTKKRIQDRKSVV